MAGGGGGEGGEGGVGGGFGFWFGLDGYGVGGLEDECARAKIGYIYYEYLHLEQMVQSSICRDRTPSQRASKTRCPQRTQHEIMSLWRRGSPRGDSIRAPWGIDILGTGTCIGDVVIPRSIQMDRRLRLADQRASRSFRVPKAWSLAVGMAVPPC